MRIAINHITVPRQTLDELFNLAKDLGVPEVEIRNDLPNVVGSHLQKEVRAVSEKTGVIVISINALYPFNCWSSDLERATGTGTCLNLGHLKQNNCLCFNCPRY